MTKLLSFRLSLSFAALVGIALAFVPLLAVHGVESALALGLLLPPWVAATAADYVQRHRDTRGLDLVLRAVGGGLAIWAVPVVILAVSALRVRQCAPAEGLAFMVFGPAVGCVLAACVGVWVGALAKRPSQAIGMAAAVPIAAALLGLWTFYTTPTVYVFGAFAGYFPGAIYDDLVGIPRRYLTYRASLVLAAVALGLLFDALWDPGEERVDLRGRMRRHPGMVAVSLGVVVVVGAAYWHGDHLGHWVSKSYVLEKLGKTETGKHCIVHMPRETRPEDAERLLDDCDFHVERTRRLVGIESKEPITAYFFRNQREKKRLIGVGRTLISKPWRREVYLQMAGWPHPALGHEVVHAVLGDVGRGPFAVPGSLGGLIPNPGIVEGAAVALAWDLRADLDPDQWSRIMMDRGELPAASALMSVKFSSLPARRAYMASGSLIRYLISSRGSEALLDVYRTASIPSLAELEAEWRAYLGEVAVTPHQRGVAEVALARVSIFSAVCPHALAKLRAELAGDAAARDDARMLRTCRAILDIDENEAGARAALIGALARSGEREEALAELDALRAAVAAPKPIVAGALEAYADAAWTLGDHAEAAALYDELLGLPRTDGPARQAEVKKLALAATPEARELVYQMLLDRSPSPVVVHLAQRLSTMREDGLGQYLEARQLMAQGRNELALPLIEEARRLGLPTLRLQRELSRMLAISYFTAGRFAESAAAWKERAWTSAAATAEAELWLERIEYAQTGTVSPTLRGPSSARRAAP